MDKNAISRVRIQIGMTALHFLPMWYEESHLTSLRLREHKKNSNNSTQGFKYPMMIKNT